MTETAPSAAAVVQLPLAGAALLSGVLCAQLLSRLPPASLCLFVLAVALAGAWRWRRLRLLMLVLAGFAWAMLRAGQAMQQRLPRHLEGQDLQVTGRVTGLPEAGQSVSHFVFDVGRASLDGRPQPLHGQLRLAWYAAATLPQPCDTWRLRVRLKRPRSLLDPGGLDFERFALERRINGVGYVRDQGANLLQRHSACIDTLRIRLAADVHAVVADAHDASLLGALALGDKRGFTDADWRVLRATGTSHLFAISGLHVGLAAAAGAWLIGLFWRLLPGLARRLPRQSASMPTALLVAAMYAALAGFGLPATRALVMIAVVAVAAMTRRNVRVPDSLALALIALLAIDPLAVLAPGFWLSFLGVALLVVCVSATGGRGWRFYLGGLGRAQWVMAVGLLPLTVWFFGQSSLVGPVANLVAVPVVGLLVVPLALAGTACVAWWPALGGLLLRPAAFLMHEIWKLLGAMSQWPDAHHFWPQPSLAGFILAMLGTLWLLLPGLPARLLGVIMLLPLLLPRSTAIHTGGFAATMLDVGQGLSVIVRTRQHTLLYDAGARYPSGFGMGRAVVVPSLHALGVTHLDTLMVSHGDNDHAGGAPYVHAVFSRARLTGSEPRRTHLPLALCRSDQHWTWDGVEFRVIHPSHAWPAGSNDGSCVLLVSGSGGRMLLTGDISAQVEPQVARRVPAGAPLVLLVPHHGSKTSSSRGFIDALDPRLALVSAGYRSRFGHPAPEVLQRYREAGITVLNSASEGAVRVRFPARRPPQVISRARRGWQPYWRELARAR